MELEIKVNRWASVTNMIYVVKYSLLKPFTNRMHETSGKSMKPISFIVKKYDCLHSCAC